MKCAEIGAFLLSMDRWSVLERTIFYEY